MSGETEFFAKRHSSMVFQTVQTLVLVANVALVAWTANRVVQHGEALSAQHIQIIETSSRVSMLEGRASPVLESYIKSTDRRLEELEATAKEVTRLTADVHAVRETQLWIKDYIQQNMTTKPAKQ